MNDQSQPQPRRRSVSNASSMVPRARRTDGTIHDSSRLSVKEVRRGNRIVDSGIAAPDAHTDSSNLSTHDNDAGRTRRRSIVAAASNTTSPIVSAETPPARRFISSRANSTRPCDNVAQSLHHVAQKRYSSGNDDSDAIFGHVATSTVSSAKPFPRTISAPRTSGIRRARSESHNPEFPEACALPKAIPQADSTHSTTGTTESVIADRKYDPTSSVIEAAEEVRRIGVVCTTKPLRYSKSNRLVKCSKWIFTAYDHQWAHNGLPFDSTETLPHDVQYICGKPEFNTTIDPRTGMRRQHFQGLIIFKNSVQWDQVQKSLKMKTHPWVWAIGNEQLTQHIAYTKKEDSAVIDDDGETMWREVGSIPANQFKQGEKSRVSLEMLKEGASIEDILEYDSSALYRITHLEKAASLFDKPQMREGLQVYLISGPTGVGKTFAITRMLEPEIYNKPHPKPGQTDFWMGYAGEQSVLFDDFHPSRYPLLDLLNYLQEYPMRVPVKGGHAAAKWDRVYISTNVPIEQWYESQQKNPQFAENYRALLRRIPPENRLHFHTKLPRGMVIDSWEDLVNYQAIHVPPPAAVTLSRAMEVVDVFREMWELGKTAKDLHKLANMMKLTKGEYEEVMKMI